MVDVGTTALAVIFYLIGSYGLCLVVIALAIISGLGAVVKAVFNPEWYQAGRAQAGLEFDFLNPRRGIASLILTKILIIAGLLWFAHYVAAKGGYL